MTEELANGQGILRGFTLGGAPQGGGRGDLRALGERCGDAAARWRLRGEGRGHRYGGQGRASPCTALTVCSKSCPLPVLQLGTEEENTRAYEEGGDAGGQALPLSCASQAYPGASQPWLQRDVASRLGSAPYTEPAGDATGTPEAGAISPAVAAATPMADAATAVVARTVPVLAIGRMVEPHWPPGLRPVLATLRAVADNSVYAVVSAETIIGRPPSGKTPAADCLVCRGAGQMAAAGVLIHILMQGLRVIQ
jgi:hypothetical protein